MVQAWMRLISFVFSGSVGVPGHGDRQEDTGCSHSNLKSFVTLVTPSSMHTDKMSCKIPENETNLDQPHGGNQVRQVSAAEIQAGVGIALQLRDKTVV